MWANRAGAPLGAQYQTRHERDALEPDRHGFGSSAHGEGIHRGAAGAASGARYEVVHRHKASAFAPTAPFANNSEAWAKSVAHFPGPRAGPAAQVMHHNDTVLFEVQRHPAIAAGSRATSAGPRTASPLRVAGAVSLSPPGGTGAISSYTGTT
mmetsp:Transcript_2102/g.5148  ORF Transcript_2102/g.5148 Transcript_2102/m.5148 type:complete len:153 (-) Transcript_2102:104-562(-)